MIKTNLVESKNERNINNRINFVQSIVIVVILTVINNISAAQYRDVASSIADNEVIVAPFNDKTWIESNVTEDDEGILVNTKTTISNWQENAEYSQNWNLENDNEPTIKEKTSFVTKSALKYLDKRLSGEIRKQKQLKNTNSVIYRAAQVQSALTPSSEVGVSENIRIKFKARVLQGKARMIVENPFVELNSEVKLNGKVKVNVAKDFNKVGLVASMQYNVNENNYTTSLTKKLTSNLSASIVSTQSAAQTPADNSVEKIVSVDYVMAF